MQGIVVGIIPIMVYSLVIVHFECLFNATSGRFAGWGLNSFPKVDQVQDDAVSDFHAASKQHQTQQDKDGYTP